MLDRFPQWSHNGRFVAFNRQYLDSPNPPKQIIIADLQAGTEFVVPKDQGCSHEAGRFCWSDDSSSILIKEVQAGGSIVLKVLRVEDMNLTWLITSPDIIGGAFRPGMNQVLCMSRQEIAVYSLNEMAVINRVRLIGCSPTMQTLRGPAWYVERERLFFIANRGNQVHQWDYDEDSHCIFQAQELPRLDYRREKYTVISRDGKKVPVLRLIPEKPNHLAVEFIFGGPAAPIDSENPIIRQLLHRGYEIICPVYRGQIGAGKEHQEANIGEMGRADVWDVVECGLDWKRRTGDARPIALIGFSYGGLLTQLALADNSTLWVAGVTLWGGTGLDHLGFYKSRAYPSDPEQMEAERKRRSPLIQSEQIRTPLFMLHGGRDTTSTNEEVRKIQNSLQSNDIPCELTIFQDDTHGLTRHRQEMFAKLFEFLQKFE
ncbi:alpha/beta hydrolase family protein [Paenibacillus oceani]|uniref:Prolyl oligopeptidase family serine peptidase n=1 Tax=Paenibacillus oceani TaxID=2772510 RepID=A0A927CCC5_9BACL|nr:prolyl oligopeptidase family serine peptidase [Paenibacillus oceani]MBD2863977.1 prolyl oligopeptidase family serine peptidase [Paenibacillus oceani]